MKKIRGALALLLALCMVIPAAFAAEEERQMQPTSPWAYGDMTDIAALGLWSDDYYYCALDPVTGEQLEKITSTVSAKLALLGKTARDPAAGEPALVVDSTRGGVTNALYQAMADYDFGQTGTPAEALAALGVVQGDGEGQSLERVCTLEEALVMAKRLVLALYDQSDAGAKGLLWKAQNGENTLWLLGSIHVDRGNVYPFHKSLRDAIIGSETVALEIDFGDAEGAQAFMALQFYSDGTTLKDHVSPEIYTAAIAAGADIGLTEEETASIKPWALANAIESTNLNSGAEGTGASGGETPMVIDAYLYSAGVNLGHTIAGVESYEYQGNMFDGLSPEYQEAYLDAVIQTYYGETQTSTESATQGIDDMLVAWTNRDPAAFAVNYDKEAMLATGDELVLALFAERDPGMIAWADTYLKQEGAHTGIMTVGAAHMVGDTGIVEGLRALGYTVELAE